jgi:hypothetical protein
MYRLFASLSKRSTCGTNSSPAPYSQILAARTGALMVATFNRSDHGAFSALQALGRSTVPAILASGYMNTRSNITVMKSLRFLIETGLARRIKATHRWTPGHWELLPGAVALPLRQRNGGQPEQIGRPLTAKPLVLHGAPPAFVAPLTLEGLCKQRMGK